MEDDDYVVLSLLEEKKRKRKSSVHPILRERGQFKLLDVRMAVEQCAMALTFDP